MTNDSQLAQTNGTANLTTESADFLAQNSARLNSRSLNNLRRSCVASTGTEGITKQFADVLVKKSQRLHTKSLDMLYRRFPQLSAYLDLIPKKVGSRTNWTPQVRRAIISISEALGADLSQYAPFDLSQPFNDQGVRRMLPRLALLVAGRLDADDECRKSLSFWLKHQAELRRQKAGQPVSGWDIYVLYNDGATGPAFHPQARR